MLSVIDGEFMRKKYIKREAAMERVPRQLLFVCKEDKL
jgi:hypothetical protein